MQPSPVEHMPSALHPNRCDTHARIINARVATTHRFDHNDGLPLILSIGRADPRFVPHESPVPE